MRFPTALVLCLLAAPALGAPAARSAAPSAAPSAALAGWWHGVAMFRGAGLEMRVHVTLEGGAPRATLTAPDLMLLEHPLERVAATGRRLSFDTTDEHPIHFSGVLEGDSLRLSGAAPSAPGAPAPRTAERITLALGRSPVPEPPPYATRDVRFSNGATTLAGTVYLPRDRDPHRAGVVLLQGSSANLRTDHRFHADRFAREGYAVLVFDKRGAGGSRGDYGAATYEDLAGDAVAAVACLQAQPGVDSTRVGVWGLGQGALLAPRVAARVPNLRFLVAISAPGIPPGESAAFRDSARLAAAGFDKADIRRVVTIEWRLAAWLRNGENAGELGALLAEARGTPWQRASLLPPRLPTGAALEGWHWRGRALDPAPWWSTVNLPVLVIHGAADELLPASPNAKAISRALRKGRVRDVTMRTFPAADHQLLRLPPVAGGPWDWPRPAPGYLELVSTWMRQRSSEGPAANRDE